MSLPFGLTEISVNISDICESMPGKTHSSQVIETEYFKISDDYISTLFNSLPNRVKEVIKNHGYPTKY